MNTRAKMSLAYGPGLLSDGAIGVPTELIIQARNDQGENRRSGRDHFEVRITKLGEDQRSIQNELIDHDNGSYTVKYMVEEECECKIEILFEDDSKKLVPIRGSPYRASFSAKSQPQVNGLTGPAMNKYLQNGLEEIHTFISETTKGAQTKEKNLNDTKLLISVKDNVDSVFNLKDEIVLKLDCLDESLKMF